MQRVAYPYTTVTTALSVFDRQNQYRPQLWINAPEDIKWLNREDNGLLLTLIEKFGTVGEAPLNEPIYRWTEDTRLEIDTTITAAVSATATSMTLADPRLAVVGTQLIFPNDGAEIVDVTAINYTTGVATVTRGANGTPKSAKASGAKLIAMSNYMAELSDPRDGNGRVPTTSNWNCIAIVSETFKVSRLQENSYVADGWGQAQKASIDTMLNVRRQVGKALLFQSRATYSTASEGQMYIGNGLYNYMASNLLDLGSENSNLTWPILNSWLESTFDPDASSTVKELICGQTLFAAIQRMKRDQGDGVEPYFEPSVGTMVYTIKTDGGYFVNCYLDKYGLAVRENLGDWGFLLDMAHVSGMRYEGLDFQWLQNIQDNRSVMQREDCFIGSFSLKVEHESLHGVIRGAGGGIVRR